MEILNSLFCIEEMKNEVYEKKTFWVVNLTSAGISKGEFSHNLHRTNSYDVKIWTIKTNSILSSLPLKEKLKKNLLFVIYCKFQNKYIFTNSVH